MAVQAFDLAERLQTPVFVMSDLDIGMNDWMCRDLKWDDTLPARSRQGADAQRRSRSSRSSTAISTRMATAFPTARCPACTRRRAYFTRGSGHTQYGVYTEDSAEYQIVLDRLLKKWDTAKKLVPRAVIDATAGSDIGIVSFGSCDGAIHEAIDVLKAQGVRVNYMRVRAFPFTEDVERFLAAHTTAVRRRAESRRAVPLAAHARNAGGEGEAALAAALQRPADLLQLHRRRRAGRSAARARSSKPRRSETRHDVSSPNPRLPIPRCRRTSSASRAGTTKARSPRCARAAATTPSPRPSSRRAGSCRSQPQNLVKLSGIGCSSKTTAYFVSGGHGFNSVHGRMPSIAMGANAANRELQYIGVSGDGDTLSIGLGQFCHAIRRNLNMLYIIENNGVYGLTKGQFSASADVGTKAKKGETNFQPPIDPVLLAMTLGATFVARSFSGDKQQLVPLIQAGLRHKGFALIDVLSPCVTFNDHEGSTKSYAYTREHYEPAVHADFIPLEREIMADYKEGEALPVVMHDGSRIVLRKLDATYDPTNRTAARDADPGAHEGRRIPHRACCTWQPARRNSTT